MGLNQNAWCKYHRISDHTTDDCKHLKREIQKLIQDEKLRGYVKGNRSEERNTLRNPTRTERMIETGIPKKDILSTPFLAAP